MKKTGFLLTVLLIMGAIISDNCFADLAALTEEQMKNVTAQAGIVLTAADIVRFDTGIDVISYGDDDGNGINGAPGYLSFNNIEMKGYVNLAKPATIDVTTQRDPFNGMITTGLDISLDGAEIHMDKFAIGSITVGDAPGQGDSFGSIVMLGYHSKISGNIRITAR
jgi:hypothetical protein